MPFSHVNNAFKSRSTNNCWQAMHAQGTPPITKFRKLTVSTSSSSMNWPSHAPKHRINDNVYGIVKIPAPIDKIIDTVEFQRLRDLKQTGLVNLVFPNCEHSRFVHSLGTFYLAYQLVDKLRHSQPSLQITPSDHMCTAIAALLHDIGHGPWSHLFDGEFARRAGNSFKHEEMSVQIIELIMHKDEIREACAPVLGDTEEAYLQSVKFIQELITARPFDFQDSDNFKNSSDEVKAALVEHEWNAVVQGRGVDKAFLYDIVSNSYNGHDVDKMDYLLRDSKASGVAITFSEATLSRLLDHVRVVIDPMTGLKRIGYSKKCEGDIKSIGDSRQLLHSQVYQHKAVRFMEILLVDALFKASPFLTYEGSDGVMYPLTEVTKNLTAFLRTTDAIEKEILNSTSNDQRMLDAKEALKKIKRRDIGCKLGDFELSPEKAIRMGINNETGTKEQTVRMITDKMIERLGAAFEGKFRLLHSELGRGLDAKTHPIQRQLFYDGKPSDSERTPMMGCYVEEDYVTNNCPKLAAKWEIFAMGSRHLSEDEKEQIRQAMRLAAEDLKFLTPRKRASPIVQSNDENSPSSAKRQLTFC